MIYVDELRRYGKNQRQWCHMMTDGDLEELHEMAVKIGLRREWFQDKPGHPHYDLTASRRARAVILGAAEITSKEMVMNFSKLLQNR